jgi:hypothetical protein
MNEVSSFIPLPPPAARRAAAPAFDPMNPPYTINNDGRGDPLSAFTIPVDAVQFGGVSHYNAHNLYGLTEGIATVNALEQLTGKRAVVISRSTVRARACVCVRANPHAHAARRSLRGRARATGTGWATTSARGSPCTSPSPACSA